MHTKYIALEQQFTDFVGSWIEVWHSVGVLFLFHSVAAPGEMTGMVESWNDGWGSEGGGLPSLFLSPCGSHRLPQTRVASRYLKFLHSS